MDPKFTCLPCMIKRSGTEASWFHWTSLRLLFGYLFSSRGFCDGKDCYRLLKLLFLEKLGYHGPN
jgi:hypothetical protein